MIDDCKELIENYRYIDYMKKIHPNEKQEKIILKNNFST